MPECLGLYIDNKIIKYAKVSLEKEKTKIENFGIEFYEDLEKTISQIIEETSSEKTALSINLSDEAYDYFKIFSLLNKKDLEKAIATEVETIYFEKGLSSKDLENRYILSTAKGESDRMRVFNVSVPKAQILEKSHLIGNGKLINACPLSVTLPDLIKTKENSLIINIEEKTTFTSIIDGSMFEVVKSNYGISEILEKISFKENSYSKAYEICKNTTIFTSDISEIDTDTDTNLYLEDIMPVLFNIVQEANKIIEKLAEKPAKIYITGSGALINNIDLYFKEYIEETECVILKPSFIDENSKINIKDYIEVNSAIAMAIAGLKENELNFLGKVVKKLKTSTKTPKKSNVKMPNINMNIDFSAPLDKIEVSLIRGAVSLFLIFIIYLIFSILLTNSLNKKNEEISKVMSDVNSQITLATNDLNKVQSKVATYKKLRTNLETINEKQVENYKSKNAIPNLLYRIMNVIPVNVQITSIENTADKHIVINAQTTNYEYLAYFTGGLKSGGILTNVTSGFAEKQGDNIKVTIEGDLP